MLRGLCIFLSCMLDAALCFSKPLKSGPRFLNFCSLSTFKHADCSLFSSVEERRGRSAHSNVQYMSTGRGGAGESHRLDLLKQRTESLSFSGNMVRSVS